MNDTSYPQNSNTDEIDLFQLVENLWKEKWLIVGISAICLLCGGLYAFLTTPTYQASADLKPLSPTQQTQLSSLSLYAKLNASPVNDLIKLMNASSHRMAFMESASEEVKSSLYHLGEDDNSSLLAQGAFSESFIYKNNDDGKNKSFLFPYSVLFKAPSKELAALELDRFITFSSEALLNSYRKNHEKIKETEITHLLKTIQHLEQQALTQRQNKILRIEEQHALKKLLLEDQLEAAKETYRKRLSDKIHSLEEASSIAKALGIIKPVEFNDLNRERSNKIEIGVNSTDKPLYLRGTELLNAELVQLQSRPEAYFPDTSIRSMEGELLVLTHNREIELLKARKSDEAFLPELEKLQARVDEISSEQFPKTLVFEFRNSSALAESAPIRPKKLLILALSLLLGGMLGIFTALTLHAIKTRKEKQLTQ